MLLEYVVTGKTAYNSSRRVRALLRGACKIIND